MTAPFVLTAWLLLFAVYQFGELHPTKLIHPMLVHPGASIQADLADAIVIAILINSRISFGFALLGSTLGGLTALVLGGDAATIYHGLYGFNAVLTGIALGGLFPAMNWWSTLYALIGVIFSSIVFAAIAVALSPIGMPALTAPFVLTTWMFLLPMAGSRVLQPVSVAARASTSSSVRLRTPESTRAK